MKQNAPITQIAPTGISPETAAPPVKARTSPVFLIVVLAVLGLSAAHLVTGFGLETVDPVNKAAFAAAPVPPAAVSFAREDDGATPRVWMPAFGRADMTDPDAMLEPEAEPMAAQAADPSPPPPPPSPVDSTQYWLTGLIRDGTDSLALVHDGVEEQLARPGSHLSGGETVIEIGADNILVGRADETIRIVFREDEAALHGTEADMSDAAGMNDQDWGEDDWGDDTYGDDLSGQ